MPVQHLTERRKKEHGDIWVVGPGTTLFEASEDLRSVPEDKLMSFQLSFPNVIHHFGVKPRHWAFLDPGSAVPGLEYLLENPDYDITIYLPEQYTTESADFFLFEVGGSEDVQDADKWQNYLTKLKLVTELPKVEVVYYPMQTARSMLLTKPQPTELLATSTTKDRFKYNKAILGTGFFSRNKQPIPYTPDTFYHNHENKVTYCILPMLEYLGFNRVMLGGFDGKVGRFYDPQEKIDPRRNRTQHYWRHFHYLENWVKWTDVTKMKIFSYTSGPIGNKITKKTIYELLNESV